MNPVEPIRSATEPVRNIVGPVANTAEPIDSAAEPVRNAAEAVRNAVGPVANTAEALASATGPWVGAEPPAFDTSPSRPFSSARFESRLWLAQRISAMVLAVCVLVHLITIVLAVRGGLSAAEILGRLRGSGWWLAFYLLFVAAVAVHAPLGLRAIVAEWLGWRGRFLLAGTFLTGTVLLALGLRAIAGVFGGPA